MKEILAAQMSSPPSIFFLSRDRSLTISVALNVSTDEWACVNMGVNLNCKWITIS